MSVKRLVDISRRLHLLIRSQEEVQTGDYIFSSQVEQDESCIRVPYPELGRRKEIVKFEWGKIVLADECIYLSTA